MMTMKRDMTGAGVVLAVMAALADVDCPVRVTGLLPLRRELRRRALAPAPVTCCATTAAAPREVTNTDAEGRLVLADAMAYAVAELEPDAIVDVATLTGAMKIALGQRTGGFFANDDALADAGAHRVAGGRASRCGGCRWCADYEERISSKVADADNAGGGPGAITAALFLQHFAGGLPWAHLDIASVGDSPGRRVRVLQGRDRLRCPCAAALARAARAAGRRAATREPPALRGGPPPQASYLDALRELSAEGNSHYLDLVLPPEPASPGSATRSRRWATRRSSRSSAPTPGAGRPEHPAAGGLGHRHLPVDARRRRRRRADLAAPHAHAVAAAGRRPHRVRRPAVGPAAGYATAALGRMLRSRPATASTRCW